MEKSTGKFARYFKRLLQVEMTTGDAGVGSTGGFSGENINSSDFYAPKDGRNLFGKYSKHQPKVQTRLGKRSKKIKQKLKKTKKLYSPGRKSTKKSKKVYLPGDNA